MGRIRKSQRHLYLSIENRQSNFDQTYALFKIIKLERCIMQRVLLVLFLFLTIVQARDGFHKERILFCLNKDIPGLEIMRNGEQLRTDISGINALLEKYDAVDVHRWLTSAKEHDVVGDVKLMNVYRVVFPVDRTWDELHELKAEFTAVGEVHSADLEGKHYILESPQTARYTPSDSRFNEQWYLSKIMADYAWGIWDIYGNIPGDPDILLGVVDTGLDYEHPELDNVMYDNLGEDANGDGQITAADENNVDDDGNGYVDDFNGWDFAGDSESAGPTPDNDVRPPDAGPDEELSHGTHCAGAMAAETDNSDGIAGGSFRSRLIISKNAYDDDLTQPGIVSGYDGILYCAQMGARVINCSWGGGYLFTYEENILEEVANDYGAIVIGAAGNDDQDNDNNPHYPSDHETVVGVAATDKFDSKAYYSNYGSVIDISSPGGEGGSSSDAILSTIHWNAGGYDSWQGTSMAAPVAAGAYGLLWSFFPNENRDWIINEMAVNADSIDHLNSGYEGELGAGRVNVYNAIATNIFPYLTIESDVVSPLNDTDGDGEIDPGESGTIELTIANAENWQAANNVNVTLSSASPYITFPDDNANFGNIPSGSAATNTSDALEFTFTSDAPLQEIFIDVTIQANQSGDYPYEVIEQISVTPKMNQMGFPVLTSSEITLAVACDSLLGTAAKHIVVITEEDSLYALDSNGSVLTGFPVYVEFTTAAPAVADVDQDGQKEIVIGNRYGDLRIYDNDGTLAMEKVVGEQIHNEIAIDNLDSDAELEIVFGTMTRNIYAINPDGSELSGFPVGYNSPVQQGPALGDLTGNGVPEIVFGLINTELHVLDANGSELTNFPVSLESDVTKKPLLTEIIDGNNVSSYHIVVTTDNDKIVRVDMDGTMTVLYESSAIINSAPSLCDINKNDTLDILFGNDDGKLYAVNMNGDSLQNYPFQLEGEIRSSPVMADLDNNGTIEIIVSTQSGYLYALNNDGSHYANFPALFSGHLEGSGSVCDLDNDGDFELVVGGLSGLQAVDVQENKGVMHLWSTFQANSHRTAFFRFKVDAPSPIDQKVNMANTFQLNQNFPNPFNPETRIRFSIPQNGIVEIAVYNLLGQQIRVLTNKKYATGTHELIWDGRNQAGQSVSSGLYVYRLDYLSTKGDVQQRSRKMLLMR
ncbi:MAG: S8 family serine peptidase [Caldithrix sp.]|nr:S8 family serine peptidase [Caldithrix sp.]